MILALETSGRKCGVALWDDELRGWSETEGDLRHNEILFLQVDALLEENGVSPADLRAVAVSSGPGSFTGLRVGMAAAKGLSWSLHLPFLAIPTMEAMVRTAPADKKRVLTLMPARADEVYWALFEIENGRWIRRTADDTIEIGDLPRVCSGNVFLCGEGFRQHRQRLLELFSGRLIHPDESLPPTVIGVAQEAAGRFRRGHFDDLMKTEPNYCYAFPRRQP